MHINRLAKSIVGVERIKVRSIAIDGAGALVIDAEPYRARSCRCGKCGRDAPRYDAGRGVRLWRCCDVGGMKAYVRSEAFRVSCPECGIVAREVPWAAHGSRFTYAFEDTCCWCALSMSKVACQKLMRVSWRTVGSICSRVEARLSEARPPVLDGLVRIGVDETSYRKGYKYMTVIVNHDTGAVVWCHDGHGKEVFGEFLSGLTEEQRASIELVSADGARWVDEAMAEWLPGAARCIDTFHVVQWATDLLDEVRKQAWREVARAARKEPARRRGRPRKGEGAPCGKRKAAAVKGLRYPLLKNPENLTERQQAALEMAAISHPRLWRAYLLKEGLRLALKLPADQIRSAIQEWRGRAWRSRIPEFVELQKKIARHLDAIVATAENGLTNARVESVNNKIKVIVRMAYGFRNLDNLFAMVMLRCSGLEVPLPGRPYKTHTL